MKRVLQICCMMLLSLPAMAQEDENIVPVADSLATEEVQLSESPPATEEYEVDPDAFFIEHKVTMGEKIIMISRKYMVDPFDIYEYNDAVNGVEAGTILYIPLHKSHKKDLDKFKAELVKKNGGNPIQVAAPPKREKEKLYEDKEEDDGF